MRIVHLDTERTWRGGEFQAMSLAKELRELGHDSYIIGREGSPFLDEAGKEGFECMAVDPVCEWDVFCTAKIRNAVRHWRADIVHAHTAHAGALGALSKTGLVKLVIHRRVDYHISHFWPGKWKYNKADLIIAVSNKVKEVLTGCGLSEHKIVVIYSGIDTARISGMRAVGRRELGLPESGRIVGFAGALTEQKDPLTFINAFTMVSRQLSDVIGVIAGEGAMRPVLEREIRRLSLQNKVFLLGFRTDILDILPLFDVFVSTSVNEGLGTSVMEAMWAGVPVVTTPAGGLPEILEHGASALVAPFKDSAVTAESVIRILNDRSLARSLGEAGKKRASELSIKQMTVNTEKAYAALIGNNHS